MELRSFVGLFSCPVTGSQFEATLILSESAVSRSKEVEIREVGTRSPHNEGLYEAGKALLVESIEVGRDFSKSMITVATGSIPVYLALVGLAVGKEFRPSLGEGIVLVLGPAGFLLSATAFAIGYFPRSRRSHSTCRPRSRRPNLHARQAKALGYDRIRIAAPGHRARHRRALLRAYARDPDQGAGDE